VKNLIDEVNEILEGKVAMKERLAKLGLGSYPFWLEDKGGVVSVTVASAGGKTAAIEAESELKKAGIKFKRTEIGVEMGGRGREEDDYKSVTVFTVTE